MLAADEEGLYIQHFGLLQNLGVIFPLLMRGHRFPLHPWLVVDLHLVHFDFVSTLYDKLLRDSNRVWI